MCISPIVIVSCPSSSSPEAPPPDPTPASSTTASTTSTTTATTATTSQLPHSQSQTFTKERRSNSVTRSFRKIFAKWFLQRLPWKYYRQRLKEKGKNKMINDSEFCSCQVWVHCPGFTPTRQYGNSPVRYFSFIQALSKIPLKTTTPKRSTPLLNLHISLMP